MYLLRNLARKGRTIIASIHQPKYAIWQQFDVLVLLSNGRLVYSGPANPPTRDTDDTLKSACDGALAFFETLGFICETYNSPADFLLDVITEDEVRQRKRKLMEMGQDPEDPNATTIKSEKRSLARKGSKKVGDEISEAEQGFAGQPTGTSTAIELSSTNTNAISTQPSPDRPHLPGTISTIPENNFKPLPDLLAASPSYSKLQQDLQEYKSRASGLPPAPQRAKLAWPMEFGVIIQRQFLSIFRNPRTWTTQVASNIILAFIFGILFWQLGFTQESVQNRNGVTFFAIQFLVFSNMGTVELFLVDRRLCFHERSNGYYRTSSYFLAKVVGDLIPLRIIPAFLFGTVLYFMVGFQNNAAKFFFYILALFVTTFAGTTLAFAISSYISVFAIGTLLLGAFYLIMMLFGGLFLNLTTIPVWLR